MEKGKSMALKSKACMVQYSSTHQFRASKLLTWIRNLFKRRYDVNPWPDKIVVHIPMLTNLSREIMSSDPNSDDESENCVYRENNACNGEGHPHLIQQQCRSQIQLSILELWTGSKDPSIELQSVSHIWHLLPKRSNATVLREFTVFSIVQTELLWHTGLQLFVHSNYVVQSNWNVTSRPFYRSWG